MFRTDDLAATFFGMLSVVAPAVIIGDAPPGWVIHPERKAASNGRFSVAFLEANQVAERLFGILVGVAWVDGALSEQDRRALASALRSSSPGIALGPRAVL